MKTQVLEHACHNKAVLIKQSSKVRCSKSIVLESYYRGNDAFLVMKSNKYVLT